MSQSRLDFYLGLRDNMSKGFNKVGRAAGGAFGKLTQFIDAEERSASASYKLKKSLKDLQNQAKRTSRGVRSLGRGMQVMAAGAGVFAMVRFGQSVMNASRDALRFEGQLASLGGSVEENKKQMVSSSPP